MEIITRKYTIVIFVVLIVILTSCSSGQRLTTTITPTLVSEIPSSTPTFTPPTATATALPSPTPNPLEISMKALAEIDTLCLEVNDPVVEGWLEEMLLGSGYKVEDGENCRVVLTANIDIEPVGAEYKIVGSEYEMGGGGETAFCYAGSKVKVALELRINGVFIADSTRGDDIVSVPNVIYTCKSKRQVSYGDDLTSELAKALGEIFGPVLLVKSIGLEDLWISKWCLRSGISLSTNPGAASAVPQLISLLKSENPEVRSAAALALGEIGESAAESIPVLLNLIHDPVEDVRSEVFRAIRHISANAELAVPALIEYIQGDGERNDLAIKALGEYGPAAAEAAPFLVDFLEADNEYVREAAATAVGKLGAEGLGDNAERAESLLVALLEDENKDTRTAAAIALARLESEEIEDAVITLAEGLQPNPMLAETNEDIYHALIQIGPDAIAAVPILVELMDEVHYFNHDLYFKTLSEITGEHFYTDKEAWLEWYQNHSD